MVEGTQTVGRSAPWSAYLERVIGRPRGWVFLYLLTLIPSLVLAPLLALPALAWSRHPLFREALDERSLDGLLAFFNPGSGDAGLASTATVIALILLPLAWLVVRLLWLLVEGGVLESYAAPVPLTGGEFWRACRRWFWPFLGLNLLGSVALLLFGGAALFLYIMGVQIVSALQWPLLVLLLPLILLATWVEVARAVAVAQDDRHIFRALGGAWRVIFRRLGAVAILVLGSLLLYGLLFLAHTAAIRAIDVSLWALSFAVQQFYVLARMGVRLARQAGEVGVAAQV